MKNNKKQKGKKGEVKTEKKGKMPNNNPSIVFIGWCIYLFILLLLYLFLTPVLSKIFHWLGYYYRTCH